MQLGKWNQEPTFQIDGGIAIYSFEWQVTTSESHKWTIILRDEKGNLLKTHDSIIPISAGQTLIANSQNLQGLSTGSHTINFRVLCDLSDNSSFDQSTQTVTVFSASITIEDQSSVTPVGQWEDLQVEETQGVVSFSGVWAQTSVGSTSWTLKVFLNSVNNQALITNTAQLVADGRQTISGNTQLDAGTYTFIFYAKSGKTIYKKNRKIQVSGITGTISKISCTRDSYGATISWKWTPNITSGCFYQGVVEISDDSSFNDNPLLYNTEIITSGGTLSVNVSGLNPSKTYYYRINMFGKKGGNPNINNIKESPDLILTTKAKDFTTDVPPVVRPVLNQWDWNETLPKRKAYTAVSSRGRLDDFSYSVWNEMISWICSILNLLSQDTDSQYNDSRARNAKCTASNRILTASRWNNCMKIYNEIIRDYFNGSNNDYMSTNKRARVDQVNGSEFLKFASVMNNYVRGFNNRTIRPNWPD